MVYFPNATSSEIAMEKNCYLCCNWKIRYDNETESCPIIDIHYARNYSQCKNGKIKAILEILWPTEKDGFPGRCSMFESNGECKGQLTFNPDT